MNFTSEHNHTYDPLILSLIETIIQNQHLVDIPGIVFEYLSKDNNEFDYDDLFNFYEKFGGIEYFELKEKKSIILFKTFFAANQCRLFLQNENNYRENMSHDFIVRWFQYKEDSQCLSNNASRILFQKKINYYREQTTKNQDYNHQLKLKLINNFNQYQATNYNQYINKNNATIDDLPTGQQIFNRNSPFNQYQSSLSESNQLNNTHINEYNNSMCLKLRNSQGLSNAGNFQKNENFEQKSSSLSPSSIYNYEMKHIIINNSTSKENIINDNVNGKYTCKYEILIPNDKEFQIAKKLIGPNGYNMKKIIDECKTNSKEENVKLRLRGKGSGFKEGPMKMESDEPLHLCVSSKKFEYTIKACNMVNELLERTYEDYFRYCEKMNLIPIKQIAIQIYCGNSTQNNNFINTNR